MKNKVIMPIIFASAFITFGSIYMYNNIVAEKSAVQASSVKDFVNNDKDDYTIQQANSNETENVEQTFYIKKDAENIIRLIGLQGKFGFTESYFYENAFVSTTLYFWGDEKDILNKQLKITAVNADGESLEIPNLYKVTRDGHGDVVEKNIISTASEHLSIKLPKEGLWSLNIYLDDNFWGSAVINVNKKVNNTAAPIPLKKG